jgi:NTP pyrophosphatase (non-canonical NTP hydrolase)
MHEQKALDLILSELDKARAKHPGWPVDVLHAAAILAEEAGEVVKASIDMTYAGGSIESVRKELAQTGAMCLRMLVNLDWSETRPGREKEAVKKYCPTCAHFRTTLKPGSLCMKCFNAGEPVNWTEPW